MSDRYKITAPFVRRLVLEEAGTECQLTNPSYAEANSDDPQRAFSVDFDSSEAWPVPAGESFELPRRDLPVVCNLKFHPGPDIAATGLDQLVKVQVWRIPVSFGGLLQSDGNVARFVVTFYDSETNEVLGRYSDVGYVSETDGAYPEMMLGLKNSGWSINFSHLKPQEWVFQLGLLNRRNELADLAGLYRSYFGIKIDIRLIYVQADGLESQKQIFEGTAEIRESNSTQYMVDVLPIIGKRMTGLQREINTERFADVRDEDIGQPMNILAGVASRPQGAMYAPVVDVASDPIKLCAAQGYIKSVDAVYRWRSGDISSVAFNWGFEADLLGEFYTYATVAASSFQDGDQFYVNMTGIETLGDGSGTAILNAAAGLKEILKRYAGRIDGDFVVSEWEAFEAKLTADGFDGETAVALPLKKGQRVTQGIDLLAAAARSFDVAFYMDYDGKIGVAIDLDVSVQTSDRSTLAEFTATKDLAIEDISTERERDQFYNAMMVSYGVDHGAESGVIGKYRAEDRNSIDYFRDRVEANVELPFVNDVTLSHLIVTTRLLRAAGEQRLVKFPMVDMRGLEVRPGQRVALTHPAPGDGSTNWDQHECIIESVNLDHMNLLTEFRAMEVGKTFGPIIFPGETYVELVMTEDLQVFSGSGDTNYNGGLEVREGDNIGGINVAISRVVGRMDFGTGLAALGMPPTAVIRAVVCLFNNREGSNEGNPDTGRENPGIDGGIWTNLDGTWAKETSTFNNFSDSGVEQALVFNGTNTRASSGSTDFGFTTAFTVWADLLTHVSLAGGQSIASRFNSSYTAGYALEFYDDDVVLRGAGASGFSVRTTGGQVTIDERLEVKAVYDGSLQQVTFYKDGVLIATATNSAESGCVLTGTIPSSVGSASEGFFFGSDRGAARFYKGWMAKAAAANFADHNGNPLADAASEGAYDFDGSVLTDSSPNGNDLTGEGVISYLNLPAGAPWSEANYGTELGLKYDLKPVGPKTIDLNAAGVAYVEANKAGVGEFVMNVGRVGSASSTDDINEWIKFYSRLGADPWRFGITYFVP